jgi:hypothetical protein
MEECTMASTRMIRRMDLVYTSGQTVELTLETGLKASKMISECISYPTVQLERVNGKTTPEKPGWKSLKRRKSNSRPSLPKPSRELRTLKFKEELQLRK